MRMNCKCLAFPFTTPGNKGLWAEISYLCIPLYAMGFVVFLLNFYLQVWCRFNVEVRYVSNSLGGVVIWCLCLEGSNTTNHHVTSNPGRVAQPWIRGYHLVNKAQSDFGSLSDFPNMLHTLHSFAINLFTCMLRAFRVVIRNKLCLKWFRNSVRRFLRNVGDHLQSTRCHIMFCYSRRLQSACCLYILIQKVWHELLL
jgi:hypothetical protein